jgi:hypothetical protein
MLCRPLVTSNDSGAAFSRMLCNTSSISSTYNSNHTLEKLCREDFNSALPANIMSLLRINRESSKIQAARIKIINTHFEACHRYVIQKAKENERLSLSDDGMMR